MAPSRLAGWLSATMQDRGLSQAQLARAVGVADTQVSRWRRGQVVPSLYYLQRLAETFGVQRLTLERLAGYPVAEQSAQPPASQPDPEVQAELEAHQARLRRVMEEKLPRSMWPAYLQACEALADALSASARLNASVQQVLDAAQPGEDDERTGRRALGFRP